MNEPKYPFMGRLGRIINAGQSRAITLTGNIFDWFYHPPSKKYVPLLEFILRSWGTPKLKHNIKIVYELNGPIRILGDGSKRLLRKAWLEFHSKGTAGDRAIQKLAGEKVAEDDQQLGKEFDDGFTIAMNNPAYALEFLRQLCMASRNIKKGTQVVLKEDLIIIIEGADMILPEGEIARLSEMDRKNVAICRDWFGDPGFMNGNDSVILLTESKSKLNREVSRLPQLLEVEVPSPDEQQRLHYTSFFVEGQGKGRKPRFWATPEELASLTAGLSTLAIMQLLKGCAHSGQTLQPADVIGKVEEFLTSQLGEGVVEFKKPTHSLENVMGNRRLKHYLAEEFIPSLRKGLISGATVGGAIGSGKSFIFEAVAFELGVPILVLKNIRSMWFGQTDIIFERLRRLLEALGMVLIFVDEADTQFGGVGREIHPTERRLTGKVQAMMADPRLSGKVVWLLLTARIHLLSQDILREGRAGDVIFAIMDPEDEDQMGFIRWMVEPVIGEIPDELVSTLKELTENYSAASFASVRRKLEARADGGKLKPDDVLGVIKTRVPPDTVDFRRAQELHALLKVTDVRLLPDDIQDVSRVRDGWRTELDSLLVKLRQQSLQP